MTARIDRRQPSLLDAASAAAPTLLDLMTDGFYALFLLRSGSTPQDGSAFDAQLLHFLGEVEARARAAGIPHDDAELARYAFCAAADETVLRSAFGIRDRWEKHPLQLRLFGDQLAGEHFFDKLEQLRARGAAKLQVLEVFHVCLLLGFQGRYAVDGAERLPCLRARLGEEIARMRGRTRSFAPHAGRPDNVSNRLGSDRALRLMAAAFGLASLAAFAALHYALARQTAAVVNGHQQLVRMPAPPPTLTITLP